LGYRNAKVSKNFIPGGTTQNDFDIKAVLRLKEDLELNAFGQAEFWKVPALSSGPQHDFTGSVQITISPSLAGTVEIQPYFDEPAGFWLLENFICFAFIYLTIAAPAETLSQPLKAVP